MIRKTTSNGIEMRHPKFTFRVDDPPIPADVPVTPEMKAAGADKIAAYDAGSPYFDEDDAVESIYRAMHALAPVELVSEGERQAVKERDAAYRYLSRLFKSIVPQCEPLPDLLGICTQIDNAIVWMRSQATVEDPKPEPSTDIDRVVDALDRRVVPPGDRTRLRGALDKADAPQTGRAGADEGLGRAIGGRPSYGGLGVRVP